MHKFFASKSVLVLNQSPYSPYSPYSPCDYFLLKLKMKRKQFGNTILDIQNAAIEAISIRHFSKTFSGIF